jgi:pimeloyl-ACP methyl ester carboxylesterase
MGLPLQRVTIHGHEVTYRLADADRSRPAILLIHGLAGDSNTWNDVLPALAEQYTVLAPDLLGHGESAKPVGDYSLGAYASGLRDLLTVLDIDSVTVIGHSLGGGVALQLAYQHPDLVDRLVLIGCGGLGRVVSWLLRSLTLPGTEFVMPFLFPRFVRDLGDRAGRKLQAIGCDAPHLGEMWRAYTSLGRAENRFAFIRTLRGVIDPTGQTVSATDRLYLAAARPTLIVWGDRDAIIPVEHGYAAHAAIPGSRLEIFEGCGHFPHVEQPGHLVSVISDFVATTAPAAGRSISLRAALTGAA